VWPFRRELPVLTNEAYSRWLRAHRPPWVWFLCLSELEQEQVALIGDLHSQELILTTAKALANPAMAEAGMAACNGDQASEETLARRVAGDLVSKILSRRSAQATPSSQFAAPRESMAGLGERQQERAVAAQAAKGSGRKLFGRAPDKVAQ
jgi:hypothetical protein